MTSSTTEATEWLSRAESLQDLVREHADESEKERHLPRRVAQSFAKNELYRLGAPTLVSGADARPTTQMRVIEAISRADGSAGWNLMIGIETFALVAPSMASCRDIVADPMKIMASSTAAVGRAERCEGGWLVNGQWQFVSGAHNADVFGATVRKIDDDATPTEALFYAILPKGQFEIVDSWHVSGLRGSGSHDIRIENQLVADSHIVATLGRGSMQSNQLKLPLGVRLTCNKVGVALGIARGGIDAFIKLAETKSPRASNRALNERPYAQRQLAKAEARLRTVRAAVYEHTEHITEVCYADKTLSDHDIALAHLLAIEATAGCVDVVETVCEAAGTSANALGQPLERIARDVRVVRQHATVAPHHIDDIGRALMGKGLHGFLSL